MEAGSAKRIIEKNLHYDDVKRLLVKLVRHAFPGRDFFAQSVQLLHMRLGLAVVGPEVLGYTLSFQRINLLFLGSQVKGAP